MHLGDEPAYNNRGIGSDHQRRERRQLAEARLRLVLARGAAQLAGHRGGPFPQSLPAMSPSDSESDPVSLFEEIAALCAELAALRTEFARFQSISVSCDLRAEVWLPVRPSAFLVICRSFTRQSMVLPFSQAGPTPSLMQPIFSQQLLKTLMHTLAVLTQCGIPALLRLRPFVRAPQHRRSSRGRRKLQATRRFPVALTMVIVGSCAPECKNCGRQGVIIDVGRELRHLSRTVSYSANE